MFSKITLDSLQSIKTSGTLALIKRDFLLSSVASNKIKSPSFHLLECHKTARGSVVMGIIVRKDSWRRAGVQGSSVENAAKKCAGVAILSISGCHIPATKQIFNFVLETP